MCSQFDEPTGRMTHDEMVASGMHECASDCAIERPFRAYIESYDGDRMWLQVRAIGPLGAKTTARQVALDRGFDIAAVLRVEEAA